jgi:hypothetical protein
LAALALVVATVTSFVAAPAASAQASRTTTATCRRHGHDRWHLHSRAVGRDDCSVRDRRTGAKRHVVCSRRGPRPPTACRRIAA